MHPDPYARARRWLLLTGAAIFAWLCATAAVLGFGAPARGRHHAAIRDMAMAGTVPVATAHSNAGGQWLAVLLLAAVLTAMTATTLLGLRRAVLARRPVAPPQPQQAVQRPWPGRDGGTEDGSDGEPDAPLASAWESGAATIASHLDLEAGKAALAASAEDDGEGWGE